MIVKANEVQPQYLVRSCMAAGSMWGGPLKFMHEVIPAEAGYCLDSLEMVPSGECVSGPDGGVYAGAVLRPNF